MVIAAGVVWLGALAGFRGGLVAAACVILGLLVAGLGRRPWLIMVLLIGFLAGSGGHHRLSSTLAADLPDGRVLVGGIAAGDPVRGRYGTRLQLDPVWIERGPQRVPWSGPRLIAESSSRVLDGVLAGDHVEVQGVMRSAPAIVRGDPIAGRLRAETLDLVATSPDPLMRVGNWARQRVTDRLAEGGSAAALLEGFLIGDVSDLTDRDLEVLRRSGLAHYVAVSGGNVALFLGAWWLVLGPLGIPMRLRAVVGLFALATFVVITRWEPSVVRAAAMAATLLTGRIIGVPIDAWMSLGLAVAMLLVISPELSVDVGFQLSAIATSGLLMGAALFRHRRPRAFWAVLGATISAQIAVFPLLLAHFGNLPLAAPVANLLAAPLVTLATSAGGIGVAFGIDGLVALAVGVAGAVLEVAEVASDLPQLDLLGVAAVAAATGLAALRPLRSIVLVVAAGVLVAGALPEGPPRVPTVTVLDVGQGDAILVRSPAGFTALVDGGRDPLVLEHALQRSGIRNIDLLVVSHGDADHVGGLDGLLDRVPVGAMWVADQPDPGPLLGALVAEAQRRGIPVSAHRSGARLAPGHLVIEVLGPRRRYAAENDGSLVLYVSAAATSVLLPGDIEAVAQRELPPLRPDVLLVPHHGSATTDLDWLQSTVGRRAIISVGENTYGHPSPDVLATLEASGVEVSTTRDDGDITIELR